MAYATAARKTIKFLTFDIGLSLTIPNRKNALVSEYILGESVRRYPLRARKPCQFPDFVSYKASVVVNDEPVTRGEALGGKDGKLWENAMHEEMMSLKQNNVWVLVPRPAEKSVVENKWVYKLKRGPDGAIDKYKARLVAKGYTQCYGLDYYETFSPVVRTESLRVIMSIANNLDMDMDHIDVCTAFLNGEIEEVVDMEQPEGYVDANNPEKVCLLKKAIYGLKQASRAWNVKLHDVLITVGFQRSKSDACVYVKRGSKGLTIVSIHVDDIFIMSNDKEEKDKLKCKLKEKFSCRDLGELKHFLGVSVERNRERGEVKLSQKLYLEKLLDKFMMSNCNPVKTPLEKGMYLQKNEGEKPNVPYQNLIGSLMYLSIWTRLDITQAVNYLSQFNQYFDSVHWSCAKRVLKYLQGTKELCLTFRKGEKELTGYSDADWGSDPTDRKSYSGFLFKFGGGPVSWQSRKQSSVAQSSTEAEYVARSQASNEAMYLQTLIEEMVGQKPVAKMNCDNQGAIFLSTNPSFSRKTKHIDIAYHNVRDLVSKKLIIIQYVASEDMVADLFTKPLGSLNFKRLLI